MALKPEQALELEDEFSDFSADFVAEMELSLKRLFQREPGKWTAVHELCDAEQRLQALEQLADGVLQAAWMEYPESAYGEGYVTVLFFIESLPWSTVAIYNKALLERTTAA